MEKIKKYLPKFRPNWRGALPVVLFFGASFLIVAVFFGLQFVMTASVITVLFQIRHARYNSWGYLFRQLVICEALALFAMIATLDTPLSLLLNFTIPFALVFLQSSQFVPKGYFASAMIFVFLQFMPPEPKDFGVQLEVVLVCWVFLAIVLKLYPYLQRGKKQAKPTVQTLHTGLKQLSQMLTRIADGETDDDFSKELYKLEDTYHRMAYQMQTVFQKGDHGSPAPFDRGGGIGRRSVPDSQRNRQHRTHCQSPYSLGAKRNARRTGAHLLPELPAHAHTDLPYLPCHKEAESPVVRRGLAGNMAEIPAAHFPPFHRNSFCPPAFRGADHQLRRHGYLPRKPCILVPFERLFAAPAQLRGQRASFGDSSHWYGFGLFGGGTG